MPDLKKNRGSLYPSEGFNDQTTEHYVPGGSPSQHMLGMVG